MDPAMDPLDDWLLLSYVNPPYFESGDHRFSGHRFTIADTNLATE
eukprot:SAG11_NODE_15098_length_589_cov_0.948980_2_plen_44_part_01